jgi:LysM repeat protein
LSASLKQHLWIGIIILATTILFFVFPERAKAQTEVHDAAFEQDTQSVHSTFAPSTRLVVNTGDSLWSISQERLGPNATPVQIANEVERIYAFNRDETGDNLELILPGQELLLPPVSNLATLYGIRLKGSIRSRSGVGRCFASLASGGRESGKRNTTPASNQPDSVLEEPMASEKPAASELVVPEPIIDPDTPSDALMDQKALSTAPTNEESAPAVAGIADPLLKAYNNLGERRLLGLGILFLTFISAILMAWKLPMRREVEDPTSWRVYQRYYENRALPEPAKELEGESGPVSEALKATQEESRSTSNPTTSEEAAPVPVEQETWQLSGHRRQERLKRSRHQRKIQRRRQLTYQRA